MLWRLLWVGVLWKQLDVVGKGMMSLVATELLSEMEEQSRYPGIILKSTRKS